MESSCIDFFQFISEIRMRNFDERSGSLPERFTTQLRNAIFRHNIVRFKARQGHWTSSIKLLDNAGDFASHSSRGHCNNGLSSLRKGGSSYKVYKAACSAKNLVCAQGVCSYLSNKIHTQSGINRDNMIVLADNPGIIHVVDRKNLQLWI